MNDTNISILQGNKIELHYWFNDNSHTMDAVIQNKCEFEFLAIVKEVISKFNMDVTIETEPLANGGLKRYFKIISKNKKIIDTIKVSIITALITGLFVTPITSSINKITELLIEKIFEDKELKELEKEKLKLEIEKLRQETNENVKKIDENNIVKKRKSNFYETLDNYPKVEKISISINDDKNNSVSDEKTVSRDEFKKFILVTDDIDPLEEDEATIEIISPVLKKGKYKWLGMYKGEPISFNMKSNEFKTLVQTGKIEFKNGSSINCELHIKRKIDSEGKEKNAEYNVLKVNHYFENDRPIETPEGRKKRRQKEAEKNMLKFDFGDEFK